jgi:hypothetical protein
MNRRKFLGGSVLLGSAAALPLLIRNAFFADEATKVSSDTFSTKEAPYQPSGNGDWVSTQFEAAKNAGKPLLILLIPEKNASERGHAWGELLNHGSKEQLAVLSLCEVVCASFASVQENFQVQIDPSMWAVLLETTREKSSQSAAPIGMPTLEEILASKQNAAEKLIEKRILLLSKMLKGMLAKDDQMISQRAEQSTSTAPIEVASEMQFNIKQQKRDFPQVTINRFAAVLYQSGAYQNELSQLVKEKLCQQRIPGAKWANSFACGSIVEGEEEKPRMMACGMGFMHDKSRRFLRFITDKEAI